MNSFDSSILHFLNQVTSRAPTFDRAMIALTKLYLSRGLVLMAMLWWLWFRSGPKRERGREIVVATIVASFASLAAGRLMAHYLPFRLRPFANPDLGLTFPDNESFHILRSWSAFPSDHAMMWCAAAAGIFVADRWLGLIAMLYALVVVCIPRVYLGLHNPTDVICGAAFGIAVSLTLNREAIRERIAQPILKWSVGHEGIFYSAAFLLSFELASQFDEIRSLSEALLKNHL